MRQLADRYRDHFPSVILGHAFSEETRRYRHAWVEVVPGPNPDTYAIVPGARSGSLIQNYALEENNAAVGAGTIVWMRHRDEGGQLHFAFLAPQSSRTIIYGPPPDAGSGSPPGDPGGGGPGAGDPTRDLCISVSDVTGCDCFAIEGETLTEIESLSTWTMATNVCDGTPVQVTVRSFSEAENQLTFSWLGSGVTETFDLGTLPFDGELDVSNPACEGTIHVTLREGSCDPGGGGGGGGGGDCGQIIHGKICYGCDTEFSWCNVQPTPVVSSICPVWSDLVGGAGIKVERTAEGEITISATGGAGEGRVSILTGIVVQKQVLQLPAGLVVGDPECRQDPADCCADGYSGGMDGGEGCCWPRPPDTLYAARFDASTPCECLLACVTLVYDPPKDWWLSTETIDDGCSGGNHRLRLLCEDGSYRMDVTDDSGETVVLEGASYYGPVCDPFLYAALFSDSGGVACEGAGGFGYLISESDCGDGSGGGGGGGGGTVDVICCPDDAVPEDLVAVFSEGTGALTCLNGLSVPLSGFGTTGGGGQWFGTLPASCGKPSDTLSLSCIDQGGGTGFWSISAEDYGILGQPSEATCDPFELVFVVPAVLVGGGTVKITVTPA